jgi:iron complex outermembrane receptor protein
MIASCLRSILRGSARTTELTTTINSLRVGISDIGNIENKHRGIIMFTQVCRAALVGSLALGCGAAAIESANAQTAELERAQPVLQEIIVTAQKRAQSSQNVPISISAFDGNALQERGVASVSQLASVAPNVNLDSGVSFTSSTAVLAASIRGIGSSDFAFNIDPAVGIYIDGVYLARSVGANQDLLDVERVEVLKGPQGTLFGRNTIGGAVSIVTRDPAKEFSARGDLTTGRFNLFQARASVDLPLSDVFYSSITADVKTRNGYAKRLPFPSSRVFNSRSYEAYPAAAFDSPSMEGEQNDRTFRGKLKYAGDSFRLTLAADYQYADGAAPTKLLQTTEAVPGSFAGLYNTCISLPPATLQSIGLLNACSSSGTQFNSVRRNTITPVARLYGLAGVNADSNPNNDVLPFDNRFMTGGPDSTYATGNSFSLLRNWGLTLNGEIDLTDVLLLKSITAYRDSSWRTGLDGDGSPINMSQYSFNQQQHQASQEFQLIGSALDGKLTYVGGAYYFEESGTLIDFVESGEGLYVIDGPNWLETKNYAFFGQLDYRVNDLIGITLGGRYTNERKSFEGGQQELNGLFYKLAGDACSDLQGNVFPNNLLPSGQSCRAGNNYPAPANPLRIYPGGTNRLSFDDFSPKVGVQLHTSDQSMIYVSWSQGYKTGGWTTRYSTPQTFASSFDPEEATTYEVGLKSTWFERRLQVNGAVFQTDYDNIQLNYQVGGSPTIANVGDGEIKGVELEIAARPVQALTINVGVGYIDAYYTALDPAVAVVSGPNDLQAGALVNGPLPKTPEWKVNIGPKVELPLGNGGAISLLGDYTYTSSMSNNVERTFILNRPSVSMVNAAISYVPASDRYRVTAGATNLTDERYVTSGSAIPAFGAMIGTYNRPREWYARLGFEF